MIDSNNDLKKLSKGLLDAVRNVMEAKKPKMDPVGKEDEDIDNDGDVDKSDSYLHNRRKAIGTKIKLTKKWGDGGQSMKAHRGKTMGEEVEAVEEATLSAKAARAGKDIGKPGKAFSKIAASAAKKYGSEEAGKRVAGAVLKKMRANEEVELDEAMSAADRYNAHHANAKALLKSIGDHLKTHHEAASKSVDYKGKKGPNWGHVGSMEHITNQLGQIHDMLAQQGEYANMRESVEEVVQIDELSTATLQSYRKKARAQGNAIVDRMKMGGGDWSKDHKETKTLRKRSAGAQMSGKQLVKRGESLKTEARVDGVAAGSMENDGHLCATKVFHKEWNEGTPIYSQHAEPDANGNIAWYDVMFEHGIEKMVPTDEMEILMAETHERHGKRKMKEGVELDEARGRPRKNPLPAGQEAEPEPRQHIMQQLQRAKLSMRGGEHVMFKDGTKHHVSSEHAAKILTKYAGMKPSEKETFQKKIGGSHSAFKEEL